MAVREVREPQMGGVDREGIHHRRQAHQRLQLGIGIDACNLKLRGAALGAANGDVAQGQFQRPGRELDRPHGHRAPQLFTGDALQRAFRQVRNSQPADQPNHDQGRQCAHCEAKPALLARGGNRKRGQGQRHGDVQKVSAAVPRA